MAYYIANRYVALSTQDARDVLSAIQNWRDYIRDSSSSRQDRADSLDNIAAFLDEAISKGMPIVMERVS